ncbi:MAG: TCP-1/cpn60 chaperonin family protein [Candidatus Bathyarchaeia archaeon]
MAVYKKPKEYISSPISKIRHPSTRFYGLSFKYNLEIAKHVNDLVIELLGPKKRSKLLITGSDDYKITIDVLDVLNMLQKNNPLCKILYEGAENIRNWIGDGAVSYVILSTNLILGAGKLFDLGLKYFHIIQGYERALNKALEILEKTSFSLNLMGGMTLKSFIKPMLVSYSPEEAEHLSNLISDAVELIYKNTGKFESENVQIVKIPGGSIIDSSLLVGTILYDNFITNMEMPHELENVKVALIKQPIMVNKIWPVSKISGFKAEIAIKIPEFIKRLKRGEEEILEEKIEPLLKSGAKILLSESKDIDEYVLALLAKNGVAVVRRITKDESRWISLSTGAKLIPDISALTSKDLGHVKRFKQIKQGMRFYGGVSHVIVEADSRQAKSCCIILRGGSKIYLDEVEQFIKRVLKTVEAGLKSGRFVPGAGAIESILYLELGEYARSIGGKISLAVEEFSKALYKMAYALIANMGKDPIERITNLISEYRKMGPKLSDVLDVLDVKKQVLISAYETAKMIIRTREIFYKREIKVKIGGKSIKD